MTDERRWYAGVDWASESHHVCLTDNAGTKLGEKIFEHGGEGLADMAGWLIAMSGCVDPSQIHIAIEVPHGPVVESLIERRFNVYGINPKQMDRFRDRFTLAGAKDDSRDAETMASALRTDTRCFRPLAAMDPIVIELREWSRIAEDLGAERIRLTNRMREQLWRSFPAMLELASDLAAPWLLDLWEVAPTPERAHRIRETTVATLLAEAWDAPQRRDYAALRSLTGVAPVTKRSGKSLIVIRRQACQPRLSNALYHWQGASISGRSPPQRRLRHADNRHHLQSLADQRHNPLLTGGEFPLSRRRVAQGEQTIESRLARVSSTVQIGSLTMLSSRPATVGQLHLHPLAGHLRFQGSIQSESSIELSLLSCDRHCIAQRVRFFWGSCSA